jgi:hypothetical protein
VTLLGDLPLSQRCAAARAVILETLPEVPDRFELLGTALWPRAAPVPDVPKADRDTLKARASSTRPGRASAASPPPSA